MSDAGTPLIREYRDSDAPGVRECVVELQEFERRIDPRLRPGESIADAYVAQMFERCRSWAGTMLVAESSGVIAGIVVVYTRVPFEEFDDPPGEFALVSDLVVRSRFRRSGIGAALLAEAEHYAREAGATELRIGVLSENRAAHDLYVRAGFAPYLVTLAKPLRPSGG
ncbi:MAG TPA: GNAT family N-acetyltransferase [Gemmatimonadaceae bacterium]|jgi:ribosomal protein S18 acetylase RimI-like enzyme|nr:GNAT family N-acetyltransferase [Gemmatimonadaceae bacterium]